jgi:hypothetical protein
MPLQYQMIPGSVPMQKEIMRALGQSVPLEWDADSAAKNSDITSAPRDMLLVLDAEVPRQPNGSPDASEEAGLWLLRELRRSGVDRPTLVITSHPMGVTELDDYCTPDNRAIALPLRHLHSAKDAFLRMLLDPRAKPTWTVIEVEVGRDRVACYLCDRDGRTLKWSEASTGYQSVQGWALQFARPDFRPGWSRFFHLAGSTLFRELVVRALGFGLLAHLERAAGGLEKLAFRFRIDDPRLYAAPFEAAVRVSSLPPSDTPNDYSLEPFLLLKAPVTRRMKGTELRTAPPREALKGPAKLLFVRSQVGENPAGETNADTVPVAETDQATGRMRIKHVEFRRLENIDRELAELKALEARDPAMLSVDVIDLSKETGGPDSAVAAKEALLRKLKSAQYDVVHFAGHSLTTKDSLTLLVLPSDRPGEAEAISVESFAKGVADANASLAYLSSCQGSSANTVANLAQRGVPYVLGFRWDVEDDRAADFAKLFYAALFDSASSIVCEAFRAACEGVCKPQQIELSPIWASPILATLPDNWTVQRVLGAIEERT